MAKPGDIDGYDDLYRLVGMLPETLVNNFLRGAARAGAKVIAAEAKELCADDEVGASVSVGSARVIGDGEVRVRVRTKGKGAYKAPWLEWGTAPHFITIKDSDLPDAQTRSGSFKLSVGEVNRRVKKGSLVINGKFVDAVHHPGARPHPFMGPAVENSRSAALAAAASYIKSRMTREGLLRSAPVEGEDA